MNVQPYLFFEGRCEEALEFYRKSLGAEIECVMRYKDSPEPCPPAEANPALQDKVMHASFRVGQSTIMASDGGCDQQSKFAGFSLSLDLPKTADADRVFAALADGGQVQMPLAKTFFAEKFGMVADRFGVSWMVIVLPQGGK